MRCIRHGFGGPLWTIVVVLVFKSAATISWHSKIFSAGGKDLTTAILKDQNVTAPPSFDVSDSTQGKFTPQSANNHYQLQADATANDQSVQIVTEIEQNGTDVPIPFSWTDTVSLSAHSNTPRSQHSAVWFTNATMRLVRLLSWISVYQTIDKLIKVNDFDIVAQIIARVISQESLDAVNTIRSILSDVHKEHGVVDVFGKYSAYDVLASIIALSRLQSVVIGHERMFRKDWIEIAPRNSNDISDADADLFQELVHYSVYAQAAYGWPMDLALRRRLHWGGNSQALIRLTGINRKDIVKAEWKARAPHRPAYFIACDHRRRAIVLCVRGTWSAHDLLTDLRCTAEVFDIENVLIGNIDGGDPNPWNLFSAVEQFFRSLYGRKSCGHHGMLEAARAVLSDSELTIEEELRSHPGYSLVLVGHSLGGGCAALLGTLLELRYPELKVYLFGAPCVAPENAKLHPNIVSVVLEGDPFSCLSLGHIADVSSGLARLCEDPLLRNDILLRTNTVGSKMSDSDVKWCCTALSTLRKLMTADKLFPPGRLLLLTSRKKYSRRRRRRFWWRIRDAEARDLEGLYGCTKPKLFEVSKQYFRDLVVGARMIDLSRHLPSLYVSTLKEIETLQKEA